VLETQEKGENNGHSILQAEEWCLSLGLLHEWQIGLEEESYACQPKFN
jgi:hypothetical protein